MLSHILYKGKCPMGQRSIRMSAKTKIVVLHMKELIYTGIFAALGIMFIVLLIIMFLPEKENGAPGNPDISAQPEESDASAVTASASYTPGIYTTELVLGGQTVDVEIIVNQESITSIRLVNLSEAVTTMYPLLEPTLESICEQVYENQSLDSVTYTSESKYTSLVLLEAIRNSLNKAQAGSDILSE
jgi:uncharacterized protein with FMN-binding domain